MRVPTCLNPRQLKDLVHRIFDAEIYTQRSSSINCPSCRRVSTCTVSCAARWPLWFYCATCRYSGDLLSATAAHLGSSTEKAGQSLKSLEPDFNVELLGNEHQKRVEQIKEVNRRWDYVSKEQSYDIDIRSKNFEIPRHIWQGHLSNEVATQPVSRRARQHPELRRLLCKVYERPGLPIGIRSMTGRGHTHDFLDSGIAFMSGGCQLQDFPVSTRILTKDIYWAVQTHGNFWSKYYKPAPIMIPFGKTRELRRTFGEQVNNMVAWCPSLTNGIRLAMENDCRVSILAPLPNAKKHLASDLQLLIDSAVPWQQGLSRLIVQTHNLDALIESLPPITDEAFNMLSIRAKRRLGPLRRSARR